MHRDACQSSRGWTSFRWGHCWVVLCVLIPSRSDPHRSVPKQNVQSADHITRLPMLLGTRARGQSRGDCHLRGGRGVEVFYSTDVSLSEA